MMFVLVLYEYGLVAGNRGIAQVGFLVSWWLVNLVCFFHAVVANYGAYLFSTLMSSVSFSVCVLFRCSVGFF